MNDRALDSRPLIAHVVYGFRVGGLENGLVNLINGLPESAYRHMIISLTDVCDVFAARIARSDVTLVPLHKPPGHGVQSYRQLWQLFTLHAPAIVHSRNLAALEAQVPASAAGVPVRIHGEHGWDRSDPDGRRLRYQLVRRMHRPFVHRYVALSTQLANYLSDRVGISPSSIEPICNGVDCERFYPARDGRLPIAGSPFNDPLLTVIGTVGRLQEVKNQTLLARAFVRLRRRAPERSARLRLVIVGDGPLRSEVEQILQAGGVRDEVWMPGERGDTPDIMRGLDAFVLPSTAEGISNTILEAMASGLPVLATRVGGNPELVADGESGQLVEPGDDSGMADAIEAWLAAPERAAAAGQIGRRLAVERFSLLGMIDRYRRLYDEQLALRAAVRKGVF